MGIGNKRDGNAWHGQLTGNPHDFIEFLSTIDAQLLSLNRARASLEEYFVQQLRERGITSTQ